MASLLVTGAAGFIGANFVHYWLEHHPEDRIIALDKLTYAGNRASLAAADNNTGFEFVQGDICNDALIENLLRDHNIDTLVNFAAESHVDRSISGPDAFIETNIVGIHQLLKAARKVWLDDADKPHRFHHVSTDEVYGSLQPNDPPFSETTAYAPNSPYAASKAASDHLVRAYHETYGLQVTTSNCSNNYGPFQFPEKLIPLVLLNILFGKPLPIYGDGKQVRDWLYVEDHVRGIELVLQKGQPGQTYNIGGNNELTNMDVVLTLCAEVDAMVAASDELQQRFADSPAVHGQASSSLIEHVKDRAGHDRRYAIDASCSQELLGYRPQHQFQSGLRATIDWYLIHENWWRPLLSEEYRNWIDYQYQKR